MCIPSSPAQTLMQTLNQAGSSPFHDLPMPEPLRSYMGAIGPMPAKYMNDNWVLKFEGIAVARTDAQKESVRVFHALGTARAQGFDNVRV